MAEPHTSIAFGLVAGAGASSVTILLGAAVILLGGFMLILTGLLFCGFVNFLLEKKL